MTLIIMINTDKIKSDDHKIMINTQCRLFKVIFLRQYPYAMFTTPLELTAHDVSSSGVVKVYKLFFKLNDIELTPIKIIFNHKLLRSDFEKGGNKKRRKKLFKKENKCIRTTLFLFAIRTRIEFCLPRGLACFCI